MRYRKVSKSRTRQDNPEHSGRQVLSFINGVYQHVPENKAFYEQKGSEIVRLLTSGRCGGGADGDGDAVVDLRHQAITHGGLLNAELRSNAWPALLCIDAQQLSKAETWDAESWKKHRDYDQVMKDVDRASVHFPPGLKKQVKRKLHHQLEEVIMHVLMRHPDLYYYQGFDHICLHFLLVVEKDMAIALADKTAQCYLRPYMAKDLQDTRQLLTCLTLLLHKANPHLLRYLQGARFESIHCISWLLTWFSYVLDDAALIFRLFDFFLACHPLMSIYVSVAAIVQREKELLDTEQDEGDMFQAVRKVPRSLCLESVLTLAGNLYVQCPPTMLFTATLQGPPPSSAAVMLHHHEAVKERRRTEPMTHRQEAVKERRRTEPLTRQQEAVKERRRTEPMTPQQEAVKERRRTEPMTRQQEAVKERRRPEPTTPQQEAVKEQRRTEPMTPQQEAVKECRGATSLADSTTPQQADPSLHLKQEPLLPALPSPMASLQVATLAGCPRPWLPLKFFAWRQAVARCSNSESPPS